MESKLPWYRSLYFRFALTFVLALVLLGLFQLYILGVSLRRYVMEVEQQLSWDVASELANRLQPFLLEGFDREEIESKLFEFSFVAPEKEIYLLDKNGLILASLFRGEWKIQKTKLDISILERALSPVLTELPIYGDDPMYLNSRKTFSVARVIINREPAYLYVLLSGRLFEKMQQVIGQFFVARAGIEGIIASLFIATLLGTTLFVYLSRRFLHFSEVVHRYARSDFSVRANVKPLDEVGHLAKAVNTMADALVVSQEEILQRDQMRRDLVASITHDLRTPVNVIAGNTEKILREKGATLEPTVSDALRIIERNASFQASLVEDLFELSSLEVKERPANFDVLEAVGFTRKIVESYQTLAIGKNIDIKFNSDIESLGVLGDPKLLSRAFGNILDNALKYTPSNGRISANLLPASGENFIFEVTDEGPGMTEEQRQKAFDKFYQTNQNLRGMGLGLTIVKRIAELHGGHAELISGHLRGLTVRFSLPAYSETE